MLAVNSVEVMGIHGNSTASTARLLYTFIMTLHTNPRMRIEMLGLSQVSYVFVCVEKQNSEV